MGLEDIANSGAAAKIMVQAYSKPDFSDDSKGKSYTTYLNPTKYNFSYKTELDKTQAAGTSDAAPKFNKKRPQELEVEFLFDSTGVLPENQDIKHEKPNKDAGIIDDLELFKEVILKYEGEIHSPNYVSVSWGSLLFKGTMSEMNIEFKLFKSNGAPIRAVAKVKFIGFVEDNLRVALEKKSSPDLTHIRTVQEGDTLPLMSYRIYGDSKYYLEVAKANGLANFRKLIPGQKIYFPPVQKQS